MSQRPVKLLRIQRVTRTPDRPAARDLATESGAPDSGRVTWVGRVEWEQRAADRIRAQEETAATAPEPAVTEPSPEPPPATPNAGKSIPETSAGRVCDRCGAYVIDRERHTAWHRRDGKRHRRIDRLESLVLRISEVLGIASTTENTATTDGNTE